MVATNVFQSSVSQHTYSSVYRAANFRQGTRPPWLITNTSTAISTENSHSVTYHQVPHTSLNRVLARRDLVQKLLRLFGWAPARRDLSPRYRPPPVRTSGNMSCDPPTLRLWPRAGHSFGTAFIFYLVCPHSIFVSSPAPELSEPESVWNSK